MRGLNNYDRDILNLSVLIAIVEGVHNIMATIYKTSFLFPIPFGEWAQNVMPLNSIYMRGKTFWPEKLKLDKCILSYCRFKLIKIWMELAVKNRMFVEKIWFLCQYIFLVDLMMVL